MADNYVTKLFGLDGQTAVVIGGTGVLGGALCDGLAAAGAHVIVAGRSAERGAARVAAIEQAGGQATFIATDATSRESLKQLCDQVIKSRKQIDILVNCAGVNSAVPYEEIADEDWSRVIDGNLTSTHLASQIFAPAMAAQPEGGCVLNIGSVTAHLPLSKVFAYSASKAAVLNLTKNLAREYATRNVRFNVLCPGFFPAEQNRKILTKERTASILGGTPMNRYGEPEELIGAMLLLCSRKAASFITGADLYVDGGFTGMRF
jgi:NAD(P)-dependent dehydrogenase (short-subunit alcohol dehydrogenase family)